MPARSHATAERIRDVNERYHDAAAGEYDAKWGIDFGEIGQGQIRGKLVKALGRWPERPFGHALEVGAGTGYFSLNLLQLGVVARVTATDISVGMLNTTSETAKRLGLQIETVRADAEELPFSDASFDLVLGHAVLHHVPDLDRGLREFHRVLRPGGTLVFCGEPSRHGDRVAALPKRAGALVAPLWRRLVGAAARRSEVDVSADGHELEPEVDVHAFSPADLRRRLEDGGFAEVRIRGEELLANACGWLTRSLEASAQPETVPERWRRFAYRSYIALQRLDAALLEPHHPPALFYNRVLSARKPA